MKKHILVVDDDESIRSSLQKILNGSDYEVTVAESSEAAGDAFGSADLLILDLNLPIQDGWDVLGFVNSEYPLLPVIVITGLADQLDERTIPGASAFLEKPIEVPLLLFVLEKVLNQTPEARIAEQDSSPGQRALSVTRRHSESRQKIGIRKFQSP